MDPASNLKRPTRLHSIGQGEASHQTRAATGPLVGGSEPFRRLVRELERFAPFDVPVLLTGETGTGKSHAASHLHFASSRSARSFLEVNCNTLPEALVESELFGALPGAHSTATREIHGKVAAAAGGTLFLDEIADLPLAAQGKLLQLLEGGIYFPLGCTRPRRADVRIVAATNVDLDAAVRGGRFREDLYYRLSVARIHVPNLESRREDVASLARHFCKRACEQHRLPDLRLGPDVLNALERRRFPGNIRELKHWIEAACIRCAVDGAEVVEARHLCSAESTSTAVERPAVERPEEEALPEGFQEATRTFQRHLIETVLRATGGNVSQAARRLRLSRSYLYTLMKENGAAVSVGGG